MKYEKIVYVISSLEEFEKIMMCVAERDIPLIRFYFERNEKNKKVCQCSFGYGYTCYLPYGHFVDNGYKFVKPEFDHDDYGCIYLKEYVE